MCCRMRVEAEKEQNLDMGMTKTAKLVNGQLVVLGIRAGKPQKTVSEHKSPLRRSPQKFNQKCVTFHQRSRHRHRDRQVE